jgi:hypothetical protein
MSNDVPENKGGYEVLGTYVRKSRPFECNGLRDFKGVGTRKRGGPPKMPVYLTMCMKTNGEKMAFAYV